MTLQRGRSLSVRSFFENTEKETVMQYYFNYGWRFCLADAFPMREALEKWKDKNGRYVYEKAYEEQGFCEVTLPHTFNDGDLFQARIEDAGSGQKRTCAFYRKWFRMPEGTEGSKVLIAFEGMRQTCYLYVNGHMAGYYEAGVAPFGFDLTPYIDWDGDNLIAVATDNTATRNIDFCIAETPNKPDVEPGSYLFPQDGTVPKEKEGVGFFWNCNDFNPSVGGISRPVKLYIKPKTYLTLPLYSNLETKGVYVYGQDYDIGQGTVRLAVEAELRNEERETAAAALRVTLQALDGSVVHTFTSEPVEIPGEGPQCPPLSITPEDAYREELLPDGKKHYVELPEEQVAPTRTKSRAASLIKTVSGRIPVRFWSIEDPYLYRVKVELLRDGASVDEEIIETGFRKVAYDKDRGVLLNDIPVWLTGYAQRAANEWAAIGIAPEWLKDQDAKWIKESNSNHVRWMHVAASPADIRSFDRQGIVCTQPAGDKEAENFGRRWDQRVELMRDIIIAFRNHPSILFWEAGNNSVNKAHMREMRLLKEELDPRGGRFMGCRTINTEEVVEESEYVGTMLNRHAARFLAEHGPITETEYSREEAPRRIWDDFTPPDFDYRNKYIGKGGKKQKGRDFYDLTSEELALAEAKGYSEFFHDRIGGASGRNLYSAAAALCWTDSAQHGRQSWSENGRMSGRVDAVRIKKQNFYLYQVMQSGTPKVKILGHWNYPADTPENYRYPVKSFNGEYWEETGEYARRNPHHKTVYVAGSYSIMSIELRINGRLIGRSEKPVNGFLFPFQGVDITEHGQVLATGYDAEGRKAAEDMLCTVGEPACLKLTLHTSPQGFLADGGDICYADVEVLDQEGRLCPLCDARIDFVTEGPARFLGGYNSGRCNAEDRQDSVIHENHVYAECGNNRVFLRSLREAGVITLRASMKGVEDAVITWESVPVICEPLSQNASVVWYASYQEEPPVREAAFPAIPAADALKYEPADQDYCKILVKGQEPDTRGVPSVNKNGSIWGAVLCILERMYPWGDTFRFEYDRDARRLTVFSGQNTVVAEAGRTHLLVNGEESLMDGAPYVTPEGIFVMEVNAIIPYILHTSCQYDDKVGVLRIDRV